MGRLFVSPVAAKQVGTQLRQLREDAGKTIQDVAEAKVAGATKLWKLETGKALPSLPDITGLCWLYGADQATIQRMIDLVDDLSSRNGGWWARYGPLINEPFRFFVSMEQAAKRIRSFQPELVNGLLQTPEYALAANSPGTPAHEYAEARLARQRAVWERTDSFSVEVVFGAGALSLEIGGPKVLADQIEHLRSLSAAHPVEIRVLPWAAGMHSSLAGAYTLFEFEDPAEETVVQADMLENARYFDRATEIGLYQTAWANLWARAVPIEEYVT